MEDFITKYRREREEKAKTSRGLVIALLTRFGIAKVDIEFDGGGDSGQINSITADGLVTDLKTITGDDLKKACEGWAVDLQDRFCGYDQAKKQQTKRGCTLEDVIEDAAYELLSSTGFDWINNDGGYGTLTILPGEDSITCDMNQRVSTSENHQLVL